MDAKNITDVLDLIPAEDAMGTAMKRAVQGLAPMIAKYLSKVQKDVAITEWPLGSIEEMELAADHFIGNVQAGGIAKAAEVNYKGRKVFLLFAEIPQLETLEKTS